MILSIYTEEQFNDLMIEYGSEDNYYGAYRDATEVIRSQFMTPNLEELKPEDSLYVYMEYSTDKRRLDIEPLSLLNIKHLSIKLPTTQRDKSSDEINLMKVIHSLYPRELYIDFMGYNIGIAFLPHSVTKLSLINVPNVNLNDTISIHSKLKLTYLEITRFDNSEPLKRKILYSRSDRIDKC